MPGQAGSLSVLHKTEPNQALGGSCRRSHTAFVTSGTTRAFGVLGIESQENANAFIGACGDHYFNRQGWEPAVDIVTAVP